MSGDVRRTGIGDRHNEQSRSRPAARPEEGYVRRFPGARGAGGERIPGDPVAGHSALPSSSSTPRAPLPNSRNTTADSTDAADVAVADDIADVSHARDESNDAAARHLDLARACDQPVIICSDALIRFANDAAVVAFGASTVSDLLERRIDRYIDLASISVSETASGPIEYVELNVSRIDGSVVRMWGAWLRCRVGGRDGIQMLLRQPIAARGIEPALESLARHDGLTGMPTRVELRDRLVGALARAQRSGRSVAIVSVNIDRMRDVNARHGRDVGDAVLRTVADRLSKSIRKGDSIARIDGDEFGLILEGLSDRAQSTIVANRVLAAVREPLVVGDTTARITISAGIASCPADAADADGLIRVADVALFASKAAGGNGCRFYSTELERVTPRDQARRGQVIERMDTLTAAEREVLDVMIEGHPNEAISRLLGASARTIETHRSRILQKMRAQSLPDLIRMVVEARGGR